jgi:hypothetical protein
MSARQSERVQNGLLNDLFCIGGILSPSTVELEESTVKNSQFVVRE